MAESPLALIEFPADDAERARRFWSGLLGVTLESRGADEGEGWQSSAGGPAIGVPPGGPGRRQGGESPVTRDGERVGKIEKARVAGKRYVGETTIERAISTTSPPGSPYRQSRAREGRVVGTGPPGVTLTPVSDSSSGRLDPNHQFTTPRASSFTLNS